MKISYLSTFYPYRGGIAQFNASLYRELARANEIQAFTFTVQYPSFLFPGKTQYVQKGDHTDIIRSIRILNSANPLTYRYAASRISKFDPDINIMKFWTPYFAPSLGYVAGKLRRHGTKNIAILDNVIPHEKHPGDIRLIKYFLNRCAGFVCMSSTVRTDLLSLKPNANYIDLEHPLYTHFPPKPDRNEALKALGLDPANKYLLFFGFIRKYKGLDLLLEALKLLPEDYHLIIAGEVYGKYGEYEELTQKLNLEKRISKNIRYISDNEVQNFFAAADAAVLPYRSATQSGIIGIAYNYDLPVIATDTGSLREMIEKYSTGLLVEKPEPALIAAKIQEYFGQNLRPKFEANIQNYKQEASWQNFAARLVEFADSIK